jgi:2-polyprenyl-3-methyl-5-hydroxy-6-metoxy-1,4-benzoquinol methylase
MFASSQGKYFGEPTLLINASGGPMEEEVMAKRRTVFGRFVIAPSSVLEAGPGAGSFLRWAIGQGHRVTAIEESPALAGSLRPLTGVRILVGSFEDSALPDSSQDVFCSFHVIEHVPDPRAHLTKAARVVRPGGLAFIATPNATSWQQRLLPTFSPNFDSAHLRVFSLHSLCGLAEEAGWRVVWQETPEYTLGWLRVLSKALRKFRGEDEEATAGKYGAGSSRKMRAVLAALGKLSSPLRAAQSRLRGGNEILVVLRREA